MTEIEFLKGFVDSSEDLIFDDSSVVFSRHGTDYELTMGRKPGIGLVVEQSNGKIINKTLDEFIIAHLLGLQTLASQITRAIEKRRSNNSINFISGPAVTLDNKDNEKEVGDSKTYFKEMLLEPAPFSTQIIHLMAKAGQGKTFLLDEIALDLARNYKVETHPYPLLLPIDLLGRYVGTIDDAIAGSLNNTYAYPRLSQRDIVNCLKRNWVCLALDGFDELCARVGARDAFHKITDLIDQLEGEGSVVLSARDTFFDSNNIIWAIQSHLRPKKGSFATHQISLKGWDESTCIELLNKMDIESPRQTYDDIKALMGEDTELLESPFFLTKIALLWKEKSSDLDDLRSENNQLTRIHFVLEKYINREVDEKWIDRDGKKLISHNTHTILLGYIAEEMWRASSFSLTEDELKIACELALEHIDLEDEIKEKVINRIQTHAVFQTVNNKMYSFSHDQFFYYYLGKHIGSRIQHNDVSDFQALFFDRQLTQQFIVWVEWGLSELLDDKIASIVENMTVLLHRNSSVFFRHNIGILLSLVLKKYNGELLNVKQCTFSEDCFRKTTIKNIQFTECDFWKNNFSDTHFLKCQFKKCTFTDIIISNHTSFDESVFDFNTAITSLVEYFNDVQDENHIFVPNDIWDKIEALNGNVARHEELEEKYSVSVRKEILKTIKKLISKSNKFHTIAIEETVEEINSFVRDIADIGLKTGVFQETTLIASGPKQKYIFVQCDKNDLLNGWFSKPKYKEVEAFWQEISKKFPGREKDN